MIRKGITKRACKINDLAYRGLRPCQLPWSVHVAVLMDSAYKRQSANPHAVGANVLEPLVGTEKLCLRVRRIACSGEAGVRPSLLIRRLRVVVK